MSEQTQSQVVDDVLYCKNHPDRETLLRCNKCGEPICPQCAVLTDVGYRCKECIAEVQNKYFNALTQDNPIAFIVGFIVTAVATPIVGGFLGRLGFFGILIALFIGSGAGALLAEIIRRAVGRRRGRNLRYFAMSGIVLGVLVGSFVVLLIFGRFPLLSIPMIVFTVLALGTAHQVLRV
jgi:hypothetical protein